AALWLRDLNLSLSAAVGFIALFGVAVLNGVVMVSYINQLREQGLSLHQAVLDGASARLRPVLMTSVATIAGHFPLVLVTGAGAAARNSIGLVLVGGMAIGTLFTLFVVPSLYVLMARRAKLRGSDRTAELISPTGAAISTAALHTPE
ncbi:MAG: efflux RND transporter permease subunit, partial [Candidatus Competibacteraceae bacterium]|nr:efflux RND transporter permease subunit [Candidatus Competibacteraceae bacterium]